MPQPPRNPNGTAQVKNSRSGRVGLRVQTVLKEGANLEGRLHNLFATVADPEALAKELMLLGAVSSPALLDAREMLVGLTEKVQQEIATTSTERVTVSAPVTQAPSSSSEKPVTAEIAAVMDERPTQSSPTVRLSFGSPPRAAN